MRLYPPRTRLLGGFLLLRPSIPPIRSPLGISNGARTIERPDLRGQPCIPICRLLSSFPFSESQSQNSEGAIVRKLRWDVRALQRLCPHNSWCRPSATGLGNVLCASCCFDIYFSIFDYKSWDLHEESIALSAPEQLEGGISISTREDNLQRTGTGDAKPGFKGDGTSSDTLTSA